ncbi:unnamed protein product, partial [Polarella glacialis]
LPLLSTPATALQESAATDEESPTTGVVAFTKDNSNSSSSARPHRSCGGGSAAWAGIRAASISALVCVFVAFPMDQPPFLSSKESAWIFISAIVVASAAGDCLGQALLKGVDRAIGTLAGAAVGIAMNLFCHAISLLGPQSLRRYLTAILLPLITGFAFFLNVHQYVFQIGIITMGMIWISLIDSEGELYQTGVTRTTQIAIGVSLAFIVLLLCSPGSALSVMHSDLVEIARMQAQLIQQVFCARIHASPRVSLTQHHLSGFEDDDDIRLSFKRVRDLASKLRSLLPFAAWEPRCLNPRYLRFVELVTVSNRGRLVLGRVTRLNATLLAMDAQLRSLVTLPQIDPLLAAAATDLVQAVAELLLDGADRLQDAGLSAPRGPQNAHDAMKRVVASLSALERAAQATEDLHAGSMLISEGERGHNALQQQTARDPK